MTQLPVTLVATLFALSLAIELKYTSSTLTMSRTMPLEIDMSKWRTNIFHWIFDDPGAFLLREFDRTLMKRKMSWLSR